MNGNKGFLLVELLVAMGIFVFGVTALGYLILGSNVASRQGSERLKAILLAKEGVEAAQSIRDKSFSDLTTGEHGIRLSATNQWEFFGISDSTDGTFERKVRVEAVGPARKKITSQVSWQFSGTRVNAVELVGYLVDFLQRLIFDTSKADFFAGNRNSVQVTDTEGGETELVFFGDWINAAPFATSTVDGVGVNDITSANDALYAVSNNALSGEEFTAFDISNISGLTTGVIPKIAEVEIGYNVNAVSVYNGYAYIVTGGASPQLRVIRLADYTLLPSVSILAADGLSVLATSSIAYVGTADNAGDEFYAFDLSLDPENPALLNSTDVGSSVYGIAVNGDRSRAYVATANDSKEIFVVDLATYTEVTGAGGTINLVGSADMTDAFIRGDKAYFTRLNSPEPEFYGYSLPAMTLAGSANIAGDANAVFTAPDGRAYIATSIDAEELTVIDTSSFLKVGSADLATAADAKGVYFLGAYAYLATTNDSPEISAVKGGEAGVVAPSLASSFDTLGIYNANDVFINGGYAYLVTDNNSNAGAAEFYLIDISNPESPQSSPSQQLDIGANVLSVYVMGNYAYLATSYDDKELIVINVADKNNPALVDSNPCASGNGCFNTPGTSDGLSVFATTTTSGVSVYLGIRNSIAREFFVLNATNPMTIALANVNSTFEVGDDVNDIRVSSDGKSVYLATANSAEEVLLLDISNLASISKSDFYNTAAKALGLGYNGSNRVYIATEDGPAQDLYELGISAGAGVTENWSSPSLKSSYNALSPANANSVFVSGRYAYLVLNDGGSGQQFHIIDIQDQNNPDALPAPVGTLDPGVNINDVYIEGNYAFLATASDSQELMVVDITNKASPSVVSSYNTDEAHDGLSIFAKTAGPNVITVYLGTMRNGGLGDHEFYAFDFNTLSGTIAFQGSYDVEDNVYDISVDFDTKLSVNFAYLATEHDTKELVILDVTNPSIITALDAYDIPGSVGARGVDYNSDKTYVVTNNNAFADDFFVIDVKAGGNLEEAWQPSQLKSSYNASTAANANAVFVDGKYVYLALNSGSPEGKQFHIIDIQDSNNPQALPAPLSTLNLAVDVNAVYVEGNYAFLATDDDSRELQVIDVTNKTSISLINSYNTDESWNALSVFATTTAANEITVSVGTERNGGSGDHEFYLLKFYIPTQSLTFVNSYDVDESIYNIEVSPEGTFAYLATGGDAKEFVILDIANPLSIQQADFYDVPGSADAVGLDYNNDTAYIATRDNGASDDFFALDVRSGGAPTPNWGSPVLKGFYNTLGSNANGNAVFVDGNYAYLGIEFLDSTHHFFIIDISDPMHALLQGEVSLNDDVNDIFVLGNYAFVLTSDDTEELVVVDISQKNSPNVVGKYNAEDSADGLAVFAVSGAPAPYDVTVYLATGNNGGPSPNNREFYILKFDFENPSSIVLLSASPPSTYDVGTRVNDIYIHGNYAYLAANNPSKEFIVLRISNPASITEVFSYNTPGLVGGRGIYYKNDTMYLVTFNDSANPDFFVFDVSSVPIIPSPDSKDLNTDNTGVAVFENKAYVSTRTASEGLTVVNVDRASPTFLSEIGVFNTAARVNRVAGDGNYVYLATEHDNKEMQIVGPGATYAPFVDLLGSSNLNSDNSDVSVFGDRAYISTRTSPKELKVLNIDLVSPDFLKEVGQFNAQAPVNDVVFRNSFAYLATEHDSMELEIAKPGTAPATLIGPVYSKDLESDNNDVVFGNNFAFVATELTAELGKPGAYGLTVVDVSSASTSLPEVGHFSTGLSGHSNGVFRNGNFVYIATENDSLELQIIEPMLVSEGALFSFIKSADLQSDNTDIMLYSGNAYISTRSFTQGLTVVRLLDFAEIDHFDTGDVSNAVEYDGTYAYLATSKDSMELQIVRFTPQVGGARALAGWFISPAFDTGSDLTIWGAISWTYESVGELRFQLGTASTKSGLASAKWVGPDGTASTFYTVSGGEGIVLDPGASGPRWLKYKGYFSADGASTPILKSITITYE